MFTMMRGEKIDWLGVCVRFVCGAVFGVVAGFFLATSTTSLPVVPTLLVSAGVCGVLAAWLGDEFWKALSSGWGW